MVVRPPSKQATEDEDVVEEPIHSDLDSDSEIGEVDRPSCSHGQYDVCDCAFVHTDSSLSEDDVFDHEVVIHLPR